MKEFQFCWICNKKATLPVQIIQLKEHAGVGSCTTQKQNVTFYSKNHSYVNFITKSLHAWITINHTVISSREAGVFYINVSVTL